jgi:hypothetical protein
MIYETRKELYFHLENVHFNPTINAQNQENVHDFVAENDIDHEYHHPNSQNRRKSPPTIRLGIQEHEQNFTLRRSKHSKKKVQKAMKAPNSLMNNSSKKIIKQPSQVRNYICVVRNEFNC